MPPHSHNEKKLRAWVVDVNMGYGHSRPAHSLRDLAGGEVISANDYPGIPAKDKKVWRESRELYEKLSRMKPVPIIGNAIFGVLDKFQEIPNFYPRRDLSKPNIQLRHMFGMIKRGLGKHLIEKLSENPIPLVTTFFMPAFMADYFNYPGEIYCLCTDTDISRTWAPLDPKRSRIKYIASSGRVVERLKLYGVRDDHIFLTGFPMPKELIGGAKSKELKELLMARICNLDPNGIFREIYYKTLKSEFGSPLCDMTNVRRPLTLTYMVGGAGAQKKLGAQVIKSLARKIARHKIRLILAPGTRKNIAKYFETAALEAGLKKELGKWIQIPVYEKRRDYFDGFIDILKQTDIIWTKPSEMSFYTGIGFPIIMAPPIGSQEDFNKKWLQYVGGGFEQDDPRYVDEWLFDWIDSGGIARMAWNGYAEAPTHGVYRIEDVVLGRKSEIRTLPLIV